MSKKPLKRSMLGLEVELATLNKEGYVVNEAGNLIKAAKKKFPEVKIVKEAAQHVIELNSFPSVKVQNCTLNLLENLEKVLDVASSRDLVLYTLASYPGNFQPRISDNKRYKIQAKIIGEENYKEAMLKVTGFHCHYTLPRGIFDFRNKFLKTMLKSKIKQTLIDSYNFLIAADPALTTLLQSSPFINGKYVAKDSRLLFFRGGKKLKFTGLLDNIQQLVALQPYKQTESDLIFTLLKKDKKWKSLMRKKGYRREIKEKETLDYVWNPVKINKLGTLEQRGMDINHPKYVVAISVLLKYVLRMIQQDFIRVVPSDIGIKEPFKIEGNIVYIPPHTHVRNKLQYLSAYNGFDSKEIYHYCKKFLFFSRKSINKIYLPSVKKIFNLFNRKKTTSDVIIERVKKKGYYLDSILPNDFCAELALRSSIQLLEEVEKTKKTIENIE